MPDRKQDRSASRPEFEVAWYTKELGQSLQREMLQQQLDRLSAERRRAAEAATEAVTDAAPPQPDAAP